MVIPKPFFDERPWGKELWMIKEEKPSMVKVLTINPGQSLSLQYHHNRDEFWYVLSGSGRATVGEKKIELHTGESQFIPRETHHRLETTADTLIILELAFGNFDENDNVRLEDRYGRVSAPNSQK